MLVVLNMSDKARAENIIVSTEELSSLLGCQVIAAVANRAEMRDPILAAISDALRRHRPPSAEVAKRMTSILSHDEHLDVAKARYELVASICRKAIDRSAAIRKNITDVLDKIVLDNLGGPVLFMLTMCAMFWFTIDFGGAFIDFFDIAFGAIFVDGTRMIGEALRLPAWITAFFADGIGGGIQTVSTFVPPIFCMFLALAFLEDSGYMARAAFIADRFMRKIGLPGKAFVPMIVGFGCNVPAILSARTLEDPKDRMVTVLINPFMSCGARMPVYALFTAVFFPVNGGLIVASLYAVGVMMALTTALALKKWVFRHEASPFILELPTYHIPSLRSVLIHAWLRLQGFVIKAGKAILAVVVLFTLLGGAGSSQDSFVGKVGKAMVPVFAPMGVTQENWPAAVGLVSGLFAKEAVVGTLDAMYSQIDGHMGEEEQERTIPQKLADACVAVRTNLAAVKLPFDLRASEAESIETEFQESLKRRFPNTAAVYAYLLFVLLYTPCIAAMAAMYKEIGLRWTIFAVIYQAMIAWLTATVFYRIFS
jgi:ferrous iron transport protein B